MRGSGEIEIVNSLLIEWPTCCSCCCGRADTSYEIGFVSHALEVPVCYFCLSHHEAYDDDLKKKTSGIRYILRSIIQIILFVYLVLFFIGGVVAFFEEGSMLWLLVSIASILVLLGWYWKKNNYKYSANSPENQFKLKPECGSPKRAITFGDEGGFLRPKTVFLFTNIDFLNAFVKENQDQGSIGEIKIYNTPFFKDANDKAD